MHPSLTGVPRPAVAGLPQLPTEGMVAGALQVPRNGKPVLFLTDHPVTGGYPVIAVADAADLPPAGQISPGRSRPLPRRPLTVAMSCRRARERGRVAQAHGMGRQVP